MLIAVPEIADRDRNPRLNRQLREPVAKADTFIEDGPAEGRAYCPIALTATIMK